MATKKTVAPLIAKLGLDPDSDAGRWVQQMTEDGVKDKDILFALAEAEQVAPATTRRVPRE